MCSSNPNPPYRRPTRYYTRLVALFYFAATAHVRVYVMSETSGASVGKVLGTGGLAASTGNTRAAAKKKLLEAIAPLERGLTASEEDAAVVESLTQELENLNPNPESLASPLINGRWALLYTTSDFVLGKGKPSSLQPVGPIYQDIDTVGLRLFNSQCMQPIPFVKMKVASSVFGVLTPTSPSAVNVQLKEFRMGPVKVKAPERSKAALDTTYLDEEVRVGRGDKGNLFVLVRVVGMEPEFS